MDKDAMKRLLRDTGIAVARFVTVQSPQLDDSATDASIDQLGFPLFVKPANMGSSIGVSKVTSRQELAKAINAARMFDTKVLVEEAIVGDEIECAVLGNDEPKASIIGRVIPRQDGFYSYKAKYIDETGASLEMPAAISTDSAEKARQTALAAFRALNCEGMSRVDMFMRPDGTIVVNEINTIPGFTKISMYPKLWEMSGITHTNLITQLIHLAIERFERRQRLQTSYDGHV
jgi:D-alanine-D-alanine ligase